MNINELRIGVIGGTGEEGRGIALRWAKAGARVTIGSRSPERAREAAEALNSALGRPLIGHGDNAAAVEGASFVFLAVPFEHALDTVKELLDRFAPSAILVDLTVPVSFEQGRVRYVETEAGSASEHLRAHLPESLPIVAAFKTEPAHMLADVSARLDCDCFVASDDKEAKARLIEAIGFIEGLRPIDAGPLYSARALERMTVLLIGINRRYKIKDGRFRVLGI